MRIEWRSGPALDDLLQEPGNPLDIGVDTRESFRASDPTLGQHRRDLLRLGESTQRPSDRRVSARPARPVKRAVSPDDTTRDTRRLGLTTILASRPMTGSRPLVVAGLAACREPRATPKIAAGVSTPPGKLELHGSAAGGIGTRWSRPRLDWEQVGTVGGAGIDFNPGPSMLTYAFTPRVVVTSPEKAAGVAAPTRCPERHGSVAIRARGRRPLPPCTSVSVIGRLRLAAAGTGCSTAVRDTESVGETSARAAPGRFQA